MALTRRSNVRQPASPSASAASPPPVVEQAEPAERNLAAAAAAAVTPPATQKDTKDSAQPKVPIMEAPSTPEAATASSSPSNAEQEGDDKKQTPTTTSNQTVERDPDGDDVTRQEPNSPTADGKASKEDTGVEQGNETEEIKEEDPSDANVDDKKPSAMKDGSAVVPAKGSSSPASVAASPKSTTEVTEEAPADDATPATEKPSAGTAQLNIEDTSSTWRASSVATNMANTSTPQSRTEDAEPMQVEPTESSSTEATKASPGTVKRRAVRHRQPRKRLKTTVQKKDARAGRRVSKRTKSEFLESKVAKDFPDEESGQQQIYFGTVVSEENGLWSIKYQDGDSEQMEKAEVKKAIALYKRVMAAKHKFCLAADVEMDVASLEDGGETMKSNEAKSSPTDTAENEPIVSETKAEVDDTPSPEATPSKAEASIFEKVDIWLNGAGLIHRRVAKKFGERIYLGSVTEFFPRDRDDEELWHIEYDDGDKEDFTRKELRSSLGLYERMTTKKRGRPATLTDFYPHFLQLDTEIGQEFVHYLHYRMVKWLLRYPSKLNQTVLEKLPEPYRPDSDVLAWKLLDCCSTGNAYRHLDTQTTVLGKAVRVKLAGDESSNPNSWSDEQVKNAFVICLVQMAGIRDEICIQANPDTATQDCPYPGSEQELDRLVKHLRKLSKKVRPPKAFLSGFQTQGFRWIQYLTKWKPQVLAQVVTKVREAARWKNAVDAICSLPGVGPYYGTQALCTLFMGVWKYDSSFFTKHPNDVVAGMRDETGAGPGPHLAMKAIFPDGVKFDHGLRELQRLVPQEMTRLGLEFPYLKDLTRGDAQPRHMTCVDLEHSLCYFQRYLLSKKSLKKAGIERLYGRFQEDSELKKKGIRPVFFLEGVKEGRVDAYCDRLLAQGDT